MKPEERQKRKEAVEELHHQGLTKKEICGILGLSYGTVSSIFRWHDMVDPKKKDYGDKGGLGTWPKEKIEEELERLRSLKPSRSLLGSSWREIEMMPKPPYITIPHARMLCDPDQHWMQTRFVIDIEKEQIYDREERTK